MSQNPTPPNPTRRRLLLTLPLAIACPTLLTACGSRRRTRRRMRRRDRRQDRREDRREWLFED